ncbi:unnamed protein product, partial [Scytosiphon promiscuus]
QDLPGCGRTLNNFDWPSALVGAAKLVQDNKSVLWFPAYGCALLAIGSPKFPGGPTMRLHLSILGLDNWEFRPHWVHQSSGSSTLSHGSVAGGASIVHAGTVEESDRQLLFSKLQESLRQASQRHGNSRSAAGGKQGHQRTPAMIKALLDDAKTALHSTVNSEHVPAGGFTDVGQHTGGDPRNTAWPLAREVFQAVLLGEAGKDASDSTRVVDHAKLEVLFNLVDADLHLSVLEKRLAGRSWASEGEGMEMLECCARLGEGLAHDGHDMKEYLTRMERVRQTLRDAVSTRMAGVAGRYQLPDVNELFEAKDATLPLLVVPPPLRRSSAGTGGIADAKARSMKNLSGLPAMPKEGRLLTPQRLRDTVAWAKDVRLARGDLQLQLVLREIEELLFEAAAHQKIKDLAKAFGETGASKLVEVVNIYRTVLSTFLGSSGGGAQMRVELRSREILVVWTAYAVSFAAARHQWRRSMESFGVCLRPDDLRHLVLSDKVATDATLKIADFLRAETRPQRAIFTLADGGKATFNLAADVAGESPRIRGIWENEVIAAERRRDGHWAKVKSLQETRAGIRGNISTAEAKFVAQEAMLQATHIERGKSQTSYRNGTEKERKRGGTGLCILGSGEYRSRYCQCKFCQKVTKAQRECDSTKYEISALKKRLRDTATAQQVLLPQRWDTSVTEAVKQPPCDTHWLAYCIKHRSSTYYTPAIPTPAGEEGTVKLGYSGELGEPITRVDECGEPSDGVWHPDKLSPGRILWEGGDFPPDKRSFCFDPLSRKVQAEWIALEFTEQLSGSDRSLQWAMPQYGGQTSPDRGNLAIATQSDAPSWLSKRQYMAFAQVRAYPLVQYRQLALVLKDRTLPLDRPAVRTLVSQALFQLGELSSREPATLLWRHGQAETLAALFHELEFRTDEIAHTPREHRAMQLLVAMAVYVGEWHEECKSLVRSSLLAVPRKWAADIEHQLEEAAAKHLDEAAVSCLKAKQCMCYMYGVLCFGGSAALSAKDIAVLCEVHILAHRSRVFLEDEGLRGESASLQVRCLGVMASRIGEILLQVRVDSRFITAAVRLVLDHTPPHLPWEPVPGTMSCFQAESSGHLFSVNLLTGVVLYDGAPPTFLPTDIVENCHYRRVFGDTNFEVALDSDGVFKTAATVGGRTYQFLSADGYLLPPAEFVIEEVNNSTGERLELLRHDGAWAKQLPLRLRTMHSHWLCRDQRAVVVRPKHFRQRGVAFILDCNDGHGRALCYRVPPHIRSAGCRDMLKEVVGTDPSPTGQLVLLPKDSPIMTVLGKFEPRATGPNAVIHTYLQPGGGLRIELPRFELEFEVASGSAGKRDEHEGSGIRCLSHRGYQLARCQQFDDTLPGLTRYLVLCRGDGDTRVIVPRGRVMVREDAVRRVAVECQHEECEDAELKVFCYTMHRRWKQPDAVDVSARLQLAEMFAATGSKLHDVRAGMTGHDKSSDLVRGCFVNHPLPDVDRDRLLRVLSLSGDNSALALLCADLLESSTSLSFLHNVQSPASLPSQAVTATEHAKVVYRRECATLPWHRRRRLSVAEEIRLFGRRVPVVSNKRPPSTAGVIDLPHRPVNRRQVQEAEKFVWQLEGMVASDTQTGRHPVTGADQGTDPFPLKVPADADTLTREMHAELRSSWEVHQLAIPNHMPVPLPEIQRLHKEFGELRCTLSTMQQRLGNFLLRVLGTFGTTGNASACHMQRVAGLLPTASFSDLPPILWESERIREFNPFLTEKLSAEFVQNVVAWLRLCVLEDKLSRLEAWTKTPRTQAMMWQELQVKRTWDPSAHPTWLAFEVDSGLQIRPRQAEVALHMIDNPGDIVQLNMGEGKTRVILPLLLLHWAVSSRDAAVVRLHFLSALISEGYEFLHHSLTGSLLQRKLFLMPFNRDVQLTQTEAQAMRGCLERCRHEGGALLVTPEHRQSLYLKGLELRGTSPDVSSEITAMESMPFTDVFDESDELLHHRRQLIYAVGGLQKLPAQAERAQAVQALLRVLKHREKHPRLACLLSDRRIAVEEVSPCPEQFDQLRLVAGHALDAKYPALQQELLHAVLSDPPYEMRWLGLIEDDLRAQVMNLVLDDGVSAEQALQKERLPEEVHWEQLMALRGLLAKGTLRHCLEMRPRVNYGVSRTADAKKRLAIPFRASNTPADRSEFKEPTLAITLTVLSYYYDGLSRTELREALTALLDGQVAESAQADFYRSWLAVTRPPESDLVKMDDVHKVDLTNEPQMELLYEHFGRNFEVVNFWLNFVVFPTETKLCPSFIGTNSWFLANNPNGATSGFSGTNDNHRLLPLQVRKNPEGSLPSLSGTNGKMLDLMMRNKRYVNLEESAAERGDGAGQEAWRNLLRLAVKEEADALVDCGAVLGKISSKDAAGFLLSAGELPEKFRGVVFFDSCQGTAAVGGEWMVLDRLGRMMALSGSPVQASEAFSLYDEAQCRGADLKLSPDAKALLSIGPKNGKDKVMQAAGRLRLLGRSNQSVVFVGTPDVSTKIQEVAGVADISGITSEHVLSYIMANTVMATRFGLLQWAGQGLHFSATFSRADRAEQEEVLTLDDAYGAAYKQVSVHHAVSTAVTRHLARFNGDVHMPELSRGIASRAERYGKTVIVSRDANIGGECEREMELEVEEEEEVERQIAKVMPFSEVDWDFAAALSANSADQVSVQVMSLASAWEHLAADAFIARVRSAANTVFCTPNFFLAISSHSRRGSLDDYLRPVDSALAFRNGDLLLLSEREANGVLLALARGGCSVPNAAQAKLIHLSYAGSERGDPRMKTNPLMRDAVTHTRQGRAAQSCGALACIWVFGGTTTIPSDGRAAVMDLVKGQRVAVRHIVASRGHGHMLPRSDLERLLT